METSRALLHWQESTIEDFETLIETEAFQAMIEDHAVKDEVHVSFDAMVMESEALPVEMNEKLILPRRFVISDFEANFCQYAADDDVPLWLLTLRYQIDGQPYEVAANDKDVFLKTENLDGGEIKTKLTPEAAIRVLTAVAATQLNIDYSVLEDFYNKIGETSPQQIYDILHMIGTHDESSLFLRERTAWLPSYKDDRALMTTYAEMESSADSGRKVSHNLLWQLDETKTTQITSTQRNFSLHGDDSYFSYRTHTELDPDELLTTQGLEEATVAGEYIDSAIDRQHYAHVSASIKFVLDQYLKDYIHLDQKLLVLDDEDELLLGQYGLDSPDAGAA